MKGSTPLIVASLLITTACQQQGMGYEQNRKTYQGAGAGAAIGGLAGALSGDNERERWTRGAIGAGVGALAGGVVGQYMDNQEQQMRQSLQNTPVSVHRQGNDLMLNLPSNVTFAHDSSTLQPQFKTTLNNISAVLRDYPNTVIEITGHTDNTGTEQYNFDLSDRRANAVADYLRSDGVSQRIITTGRGENSPIASNNDAQGRAQNRRVEIKISPISN